MLNKYMSKQKFLFILIMPLVLSGCIISTTTKEETAAVNSGGVYRRADGGQTWQHTTQIYTVGANQEDFNSANVTTIALDNRNNATVYAGTLNDGIFYSYDYGKGWHNTLKGKGVVNDIAVDFEYNCTIFAAVHNTIYKSIDCSRTWEATYFETRAGQFITALAIDKNDSRFVFAGTVGGSFLISEDYGYSWDVMERFEGEVNDIIIQDHNDSNILYVAIKDKGVFKTSDRGKSWEDLTLVDVDEAEVDEEALFQEAVDKLNSKYDLNNMSARETEKYDRDYARLEEDKYKPLKKLGNVGGLLAISQDKSQSDAIIYANKIGIFRLTAGEIWKQIKLLTPEGKETTHSLIVNEQDGNEIFYGTSRAIYHSIDNGENWAISELPTSYTAKVLKFSPDNKFLYLGAYQVKQ